MGACGQAAEDIATAYNHGDLHSQLADFGDVVGYGFGDIRVNTK